MTLEALGSTVEVTTESWADHRILSSPMGHGEVIRIESESDIRVGGIPFQSTSSTTSFAPPQYIGPFSRWCEGETWVTPSVTETIVLEPGGTTVGPSIPYEGRVESVNEMVTTPAGTFRCACSRTELTSGPNAGSWTRQCISIDRGVLIKEDIYAPGPDGEVVGFLEAIDID